MEGLWVPTDYYMQIKSQIHQILEASEVNSRTRANGVLTGANA